MENQQDNSNNLGVPAPVPAVTENQQTPTEIQNITPRPQPQTQIPSKSKKTKKFLVLGLILLLIIAGAGGAYFYLKNQKSKTQDITSEVPTSPTPTPDPTADWETYTNTDIGYLLKYPSTWFEIDGYIYDNKKPSPDNGIAICFYPTDITITDLDVLLDSILEEYVNMEGDPPFRSYETKSKITLNNNYEVLIITGSGYTRASFISYLIVDPVSKKNVHISFSSPPNEIDQYKPIIDQILSTFEFLD